MPRDQTEQEEDEEESVNLNVQSNENRNVAQRKGLFANNRSRSADYPVGPAPGATAESTGGLNVVGRQKPRRLSNQFSMEMSKRFRCSEEMDVVDDAGRSEDLDEIQVHVTSSRSFGLSSSFLRRKKDEYEGDNFVLGILVP